MRFYISMILLFMLLVALGISEVNRGARHKAEIDRLQAEAQALNIQIARLER